MNKSEICNPEYNNKDYFSPDDYQSEPGTVTVNNKDNKKIIFCDSIQYLKVGDRIRKNILVSAGYDKTEFIRQKNSNQVWNNKLIIINPLSSEVISIGEANKDEIKI